MNKLKLIKKILDYKKPIIISCGMTNFDEIDELVNLLEINKAQFILLHTVSSYPLEEKNSYLLKIRKLRDRYKCPVGHSDHTPGTNIPIKPSNFLVTKGIKLCLLGLSPESEKKVINSNNEFTSKGGKFLSIFPNRRNSIQAIV